jgi:hypothetical protein
MSLAIADTSQAMSNYIRIIFCGYYVGMYLHRFRHCLLFFKLVHIWTPSQSTLEILRATLEEACLKKGENYSADLHPILWSEERFCRSLKNSSFEMNYLVYGGDQPIIYKVCFSQKKLLGQFKHTCSNSKISMESTPLNATTRTTPTQLDNVFCDDESFLVRTECSSRVQGCQMICFQAKNPNLGKFWRLLQWKLLE